MRTRLIWVTFFLWIGIPIYTNASDRLGYVSFDSLWQLEKSYSGDCTASSCSSSPEDHPIVEFDKKAPGHAKDILEVLESKTLGQEGLKRVRVWNTVENLPIALNPAIGFKITGNEIFTAPELRISKPVPHPLDPSGVWYATRLSGVFVNNPDFYHMGAATDPSATRLSPTPYEFLDSNRNKLVRTNIYQFRIVGEQLDTSRFIEHTELAVDFRSTKVLDDFLELIFDESI